MVIQSGWLRCYGEFGGGCMSSLLGQRLARCFQSHSAREERRCAEKSPLTAQGAQFHGLTTTCPIDALVLRTPIHRHHRTHCHCLPPPLLFYHIIVSGVAGNKFLLLHQLPIAHQQSSRSTCTDIKYYYYLSNNVISSSRTSRATRGSFSSS